MTIVQAEQTLARSYQLSVALLTNPPETLAQFCDLLASQLGASAALWQADGAGHARVLHSAGPLAPPAPSLAEEILGAEGQSSLLAAIFPEPANALALGGAPACWLTLTPALDSGAALIVLQALFSGWLGRLQAQAAPAPLAHPALLQALFDELPEGVVVALAGPGGPADARLALANRKAEELWGRPFKLGEPVDTADHWGLHTAAGQPILNADSCLARALRTGDPLLGHETCLHQPDGRKIPLLVNCSPLRGADGTLWGAVAVFQDISRWHHDDNERDEAIASIAHDLKNPLTTIRGSAELVLRRKVTPPRDQRDVKRLETIMEQCDRMREFLGTLVDVGRLHSGNLPLVKYGVDLNGLVARSIEALNTSMAAPRIRFTSAGPAPVFIDSTWMNRVITNLLDNALKYSPPDSPVEVALRAGPAQVTLTITDYGIGIERGDLERIFKRFTRGSNNVSLISGTGLGLYTVRAVVNAHGGTVMAASQGLDRGSTFTLNLPIQQPGSPGGAGDES